MGAKKKLSFNIILFYISFHVHSISSFFLLVVSDVTENSKKNITLIENKLKQSLDEVSL